MDFQVLVTALLSLTGAVVGAVFIGRFFTPRLESRKVAAVAESEEAAVFAQHLHLLAVDFRLADTYEAMARREINPEENTDKVLGMLEGISRRAHEAAKIARAGERVRFSDVQRKYASLVVGAVLAFSEEQFPAIRSGQAYFSRPVEDRYLATMAELLDFASKVFQPTQLVWFPLRRLDKKLKAFLTSIRDDLQQAHMANLHELGLKMAGEAEESPGESTPAG
ncbi:hypothetical protein [Arthrobacter sp. NicSoilC12]|uniref:hypothetical protein n=1 Tax=Arthrobacter sp. NicSoilC12 TaxID=2831001 RepID=UPI001CC59623|nr:hypothetical protein [Arthrobacter sp. NicSoilC12]